MATELESMVIRLLGDSTEYKRMLTEAVQNTQDSAKQIEEATKKIEGFGAGIKSFAANAAKALGALNIVGWLNKAENAFREAQGAQSQLTRMLQAQGREVTGTMRQYNEFADTIQRTTRVDGDNVLAMIRQLEVMGLTGDAAQRAVQNSIAMATAQGGEAESYLRATAALENGNAALISRSLGLGHIRDESQQVAEAQRQLGNMFQFTLQDARGLGGQIAQLKNAFSDLLEDFGEVVSAFTKPFRAIFVDVMKEGVAFIRSFSKETKTAIVVLAGLTAGFLALGPAIATIGTVLSLVFGGLPTLLGTVLTVLMLIGGGIVAWAASMIDVQAAWARIREIGVSTWNRIKTVAMAFWSWLKPTIEQIKTNLRIAWERISTAAIIAWEYIKTKTNEFIAWAEPYVTAFIANLLFQWRVMKFAAGLAWDFIKEKVTQFWSWAEPYVMTTLNALVDSWVLMGEIAVATWEYVKVKVTDFVTWVRPIVLAAVGYIAAVWELVSAMAVVAWDIIVSTVTTAWEAIVSIFDAIRQSWDDVMGIIGDSASVDWTMIKDVIVDTLLMAEFVLRNFGQVAEYTWTFLKVGFMSFIGEFTHFFTGVVPALFTWFLGNWRDIFTTTYNFASTVFTNMVTNITGIFGRVGGAIRNFLSNPTGGLTLDVSDLFTPLTQGFENTIRELPNIPRRELGATEQELRRQFEQQGAALNQSWEEFRERRLREIDDFSIEIPEDSVEIPTQALAAQANAAGRTMGQALTSGVAKEASKFDAVLSRSAEALSRITAYKERLTGNAPRTGDQPGSGGRPGGSGGTGGNLPSGGTAPLPGGPVIPSVPVAAPVVAPIPPQVVSIAPIAPVTVPLVPIPPITLTINPLPDLSVNVIPQVQPVIIPEQTVAIRMVPVMPLNLPEQSVPVRFDPIAPITEQTVPVQLSVINSIPEQSINARFLLDPIPEQTISARIDVMNLPPLPEQLIPARFDIQPLPEMIVPVRADLQPLPEQVLTVQIAPLVIPPITEQMIPARLDPIADIPGQSVPVRFDPIADIPEQVVSLRWGNIPNLPEQVVPFTLPQENARPEARPSEVRPFQNEVTPVVNTPVVNIPIGEIPEQEIPVRPVRPAQIPVNEIPEQEIPVREIPEQQIDVGQTVPQNIPVEQLPEQPIPVQIVQEQNIPIAPIPEQRIDVGQIPTQEIPIGEIPEQEIPVAPIPQMEEREATPVELVEPLVMPWEQGENEQTPLQELPDIAATLERIPMQIADSLVMPIREIVPVETNAPTMTQAETRMMEILAQSRDYLRDIAERPQIVIEGAGFS